MHYGDLALCRYHSGPFDADQWQRPLLCVGWLEHPHAFSCGDTDPEFHRKLESLIAASRPRYPHYYFRGGYDCTFCLVESRISGCGGAWSQENIFVPGEEVIYVSPGAVHHYVAAHHYHPPVDYIEAVMHCPEYGSPAFCAALKHSNGDCPPPLLTQEEDQAKWSAQVKAALEYRAARRRLEGG